MLPVSSLLNPVKSEPRSPRHEFGSHSPLKYTSSTVHGSPLIEIQTFLTAKQKMVKDGAVFAKGKVKGDVNFPAFEELKGKALQEVQKYKIYPLGQIESFCRHIPYNSEKKTFLEKTGRESFEVFQYEFKLPGEDKLFAVMWDYNIGLVRITPFFKCCNYSKTTPAKMLSLNPGLKEITHSITGGALAAQGYWMPYSCALAVCATFCDNISGALIPLFGPTFPSRCTPATSPNFGRMVIDPAIISAASEEANSFRNYYASGSSSAFPSPSLSNSDSPRERLRDMSGLDIRIAPLPLSKRLRLKHTFTADSHYSSDTDTSDISISTGDRYLYSPVTPGSTTSMPGNGWTASNAPSVTSTPRTIPVGDFEEPKVGHENTISCGGPSPWLSAIPRSNVAQRPHDNRVSWPAKRKAVEVDEGYDGGESACESSQSIQSKESDDETSGDLETQNTAILLLRLKHINVRDGDPEASGDFPGKSNANIQLNSNMASRGDEIFPRSLKRRRATSC